MKAIICSIALVLSVLIAGCSSSPAPVETEDDPTGDLGLAPTATTGIIRGVVVDEAVRPLEGITVSLPLPNAEPRTAVSNEKGAFGFDGLAPGTYFMKVEKLGYFPAQQSVEVVAGVESPPIVKIVMQVDAASTPYVEEHTFAGFIECSVTTPGARFAACAAPNDPLDFLGVYTGNFTNDKFLVIHEIDADPWLIQSEMVWDSTQEAGGRMRLIMDSVEEDGSFEDINETDDYSPMMLRINQAEAVANEMGTNSQLMLRIFSSFVEGTNPPCLVVVCPFGVGFVLQQEYTVFTHVYHNYLPPEDWRFTDAPVPAPV